MKRLSVFPSDAQCGFLVALLVAMSLVVETTATLGGDVSVPIDAEQFACWKKAGLEFMVVRAYHSYGHVDDNAIEVLHGCQAAGLASCEIYVFPDELTSPDTPQEQMMAVWTMLHLNGLNVSMVWLDIEGPPDTSSAYWSSNFTRNAEFLEGLIDGARVFGVPLGVYTSIWEWGRIFAPDYAGASHLPLWYPDYSPASTSPDSGPQRGKRNFDDFEPFGGWTAPVRKQTADNGNACGTSYDVDWQPGPSYGASTGSYAGSSNE